MWGSNPLQTVEAMLIGDQQTLAAHEHVASFIYTLVLSPVLQYTVVLTHLIASGPHGLESCDLLHRPNKMRCSYSLN